jgi:hypothetical protein
MPGPGKTLAQYGPDSGRCHLFAEQTRPDTSFGASGSPKAVAIAAGVALLVGGIATVVHDSQSYDNCMQASGWLVKDNGGTGAAVAQPAVAAAAVGQPASGVPTLPQPVMQSALPSADGPVLPGEPVDPARAQHVAQAQQAAQSWLVAQGILDGPDTVQRRSLYAALCRAGDQSSCLMAGM